MAVLSFESRVKGALQGAAIGAGLGYSRCANPAQFETNHPKDVLGLALTPISSMKETPGRIDTRILTSFINLGVQAYLDKGGRVTPEDFGALLKDNADIAGPMFGWDSVHSTQEVLKEGMHPRISGLGAPPCGLISAAMPAVGIYHFNDPEYAYLDGVELASTAQPRLGADWAGLCAAAVATAFDGDTENIIENILHIAHKNNKPLFYQLNNIINTGRWMSGNEEGFATWWMNEGGRGSSRQEEGWPGFNPIRYVLPVLLANSNDARKFFNLLITPPAASWYDGMLGGHAVSAVIGGAVLGALRGEEIFPAEWRAWAEPIAVPWYPIQNVVQQRLQKEKIIIKSTEEMMQTKVGDISLLQEKVYGCMLAGAIGNAMGSPVEGKFFNEIDAEYPNGINGILDPRRLESEDDNQMAMLLVETYIERNGLPVMARHFGDMWRERLNRDHFFIMCMGNAYDMICNGWDARITGHWSQVTGSTVMCLEPVGVYHAADPEFAAIDAAAVSYMYQRGLDMVSAAMMAATVAEALQPRATVDSILQAALNAAPKTPLHTFDTRKFKTAYDYIAACLEIADRHADVFSVRAELYEKCLLYHMIDPLELWGFALAMFKIADGDVRISAIGGTNIGRDSDTIAGRAAMLAGTLKGASNVPDEWKQLFKPASLDKIKKNAGRFAELIAYKNLHRLVKRQSALTNIK
jgi:ADP-ribosylglycohydrolase